MFGLVSEYPKRLLTASEKRTLQSHAATFFDYLRVDEVLMHLLANGVISHHQKALIEAKNTIYDRNAALFDILMQSTYDRVMKFRDILISSGQEHLADLIDFPVEQKPPEITTRVVQDSKSDSKLKDSANSFETGESSLPQPTQERTRK